MASIQKTYNSMGLPMNINRSNPIPVDNTELWYSLDDAENYASTDPRAYVGQSIKVVDETNGTVEQYMIGADGTLISVADAAMVAEAISEITSIPDSEIIALFSS